MHPRFQMLNTVFYRQQKFKLVSTHTWNNNLHPHLILHNIFSHLFPRNLNTDGNPIPNFNSCTSTNQLSIDSSSINVHFDDLSVSTQHPNNTSITKDATKVQNLLKVHINRSVEVLERALDRCALSLNEELVLQVLKRHRSDWKPVSVFFNWVSKGAGVSGYAPGSDAYNEILDILGRMKCFEQLRQMFDEMSKREGLVNERTFAILLNRYASAHKVEEAIEVFYSRKQFGLELDLIAFQTLLLSLCRYKHVEAAESLFHSKRNEFPLHVKTLNIILNGWCVLGSLREAKRFWNDIIRSRCKPDLFTYGIMLNSLTKNGKLGTALKLFRSMWKKGCTPDVAICNCVIDALCFKKRIPEALEIFREMNDKGCPPNVATYNSLIKYLCKIRRMEKVYELLHEMEQKKGCCTPSDITFNYLLKSMKKPDEVPEILERMERNGCEITADTYNLILKLFMDWNHAQGVQSTWVEMEKNGVGHDQRSYTIMIHGFQSNGKMDEALHYFTKMVSKGLIPEPRTKFLVDEMKIKLKEQEKDSRVRSSSGSSGKHEKKKRLRLTAKRYISRLEEGGLLPYICAVVQAEDVPLLL